MIETCLTRDLWIDTMLAEGTHGRTANANLQLRLHSEASLVRQ